MPWIDRCLQSLLDSLYKTTIIVIDNGSVDQTTSHIAQHYPSVTLIKTIKNLGFGQGNNIGLKIALQDEADYVFLLNQDAWVEKDTLSKLVAAHVQHPAYGILSPVHLNGTGKDFDDHFLFYLVRAEIKELLWSNLSGQQCTDAIIDTPFVNAAAWFISAACLRDTGGFDPIFFHYGEDDNYGQRVRFKGYKIGILATTRVYHDKERPGTKKTMDVQKRTREDWIQFLTHACDVNDNHYKRLMRRRYCRHLLQLGGALLTFNRENAVYHYNMARHIFSSFGRVKKSRLASMTNSTPYL